MIMSKQVSLDALLCQALTVERLASPERLNAMTEFQRHKSTTNPVHIIGFLSQWKMYLDELPNTNFRGKRLDATVFEKVRRRA